jgi:hypothetical protein
MGGAQSSPKNKMISTKNPGSLYFNSAFLSILNKNINLLNKNFTIEFWIYTNESNNGWIFNNGTFGIGFEGNLLKYLWNGVKYNLEPEFTPFNKKWVFVKICFDIDNYTLNFYINNISKKVILENALNIEPPNDFIIGNNTDNPGFVGFITDFRITFDNLCKDNIIPNSRLLVTNETALLISPIDTNPYADLSKKNNINNYSTSFMTDYPINLFTNKENFEITTSSVPDSTNINKNIKLYLLLLLVIIFFVIFIRINILNIYI